jgi:hypothetical protein
MMNHGPPADRVLIAARQGYALYYLIKLGLENGRVDDLVERLLHWRWPDGGWNCDKEPSAAKSTFIHTIHSSLP